MSSMEKQSDFDLSYVNPNIIRPQDTAMMQANLHHLSGAKPVSTAAMMQTVVIHEVGYDYPIAPQTFLKPPRLMGNEWDNRPA